MTNTPPPTPIRPNAKAAKTSRGTPIRPIPNIRSVPGKVYQLTDLDLQELKLRQQALMVTKATYLLAEAGYGQYTAAMMAKYGHGQDDLKHLGIDMSTGAIVRNDGNKMAGVAPSEPNTQTPEQAPQ